MPLRRGWLKLNIGKRSCDLEQINLWLYNFKIAVSSVLESPDTHKSFNTLASQSVAFEALHILIIAVTDQARFKCVFAIKLEKYYPHPLLKLAL